MINKLKTKNPAIYNLSFDFPIKAQSNVIMEIKRNEVPSLCYAMEIAVLERYGVIVYSTRNPDEESTYCRYEWLIQYNNLEYGIRIIAILNITNSDIHQLKIVSSWGSDIVNIDLDFDDEAKKNFLEEVENFSNDIKKIINENPKDDWTKFFYITLPKSKIIKKQVNSNLVTFYPSLQNKNDNSVLTAIGIHFKAHFKQQADGISEPILNKLKLLFSLLLRQKIESHNISFPGKFSPKGVIKGKNREIKDLFPLNLYKKNLSDLTDLNYEIELISSLISNEKIFNDENFWQSLNAYVAGLDVQKTYPTLSSVAFITSLSAFSKTKYCKGNIECTECGDLNFKHQLVSEKNGIISVITKKMGLNTEKTKILKKLISEVYYNQRSAFVHDATLRHAEIEKKDEEPLELLRPGADGISKEIKFKEDLRAIEGIARQNLLHELLKYDQRIKSIINSDFDYLETWHHQRHSLKCCVAPGKHVRILK